MSHGADLHAANRVRSLDHSTYTVGSSIANIYNPIDIRILYCIRSLEVSRGYGLLIILYIVITCGECTADNAKAQAF